MAFTNDYDTSIPVDHQKFIDVPGLIRTLKSDLSERLADMISGFISGETTEGIKKLIMRELSADPTAAADIGHIYCKDVSGATELFYKDAAGNVKQLTTGGKLNVSLNEGMFRSGDLLFSSNTTVPTGWTDVSATYDNKFIRISSGTPLNTGGSDTHNHGGATGSHTLTIDEIPAHTHTYLKYGSGDNAPHSGSDAQGYETTDTSSTGGGQGHTHTLASADNIPAYVQVKVYKKD